MSRVTEEQAGPEEQAADAHPHFVPLGRFFDLISGRTADGTDLFAEDFVWHYCNPQLPELEGDYPGPEGLRAFFAKLGARMQGTFRLDHEPKVLYVGEELVAFHLHHFMEKDGEPIEADAVVVFRILQGRIAEAWDII